MNHYEAPAITARRELQGSLNGSWSGSNDSDAEIKHGVRPVDQYVAPQITEERDLSGSTQNQSISSGQ